MSPALRIAAVLFFASGPSTVAWEFFEPWYIPESRVGEAKADLKTLDLSLARFSSTQGRPPTQAEGLTSLRSAGLLDAIPDDPWRRSYVYSTVVEPPGYKVYSLGANGVDEYEAGDDVTPSAKNYSCSDYREYCITTQISQNMRPVLAFIALLSLLVAGIILVRIIWQRVRRSASAA
jgi:Type II secretion system (T2SS), protein G